MKIKVENVEKHVVCPPAGTIFRNPNGSGNVHMVIGGLNEQHPIFNQYHYVCIDVVDSKSFHKLGMFIAIQDHSQVLKFWNLLIHLLNLK